MKHNFSHVIKAFCPAILLLILCNPGLCKGSSLPQDHDSTNDQSTSKGKIEIISGRDGLDARYMGELFEKLKARHVLQASNLPDAKSGKLVLEFAILRDGTLDYAKIVKSTVDEATSQAKLNAVRSAVPFPSLPKEFKGKSLKLRLHSEFMIKSASSAKR